MRNHYKLSHVATKVLFQSTDHPQEMLLGLQSWLDDLPKANMAESSRMVFNRLVALRNAPINGRFLYQHLECFRPVVNLICDGLKRQYLQDDRLAHLAKRSIMSVYKALNMELAKAYSKVAISAAEKLEEGLQAHAIHRAICHLNLILLRVYQLHEEVPKNLWRHLYQLHHLAEKWALIHFPVMDFSLINSPNATIHQTFKSALLLSLSNPYQLTAEDLDTVFEGVHLWHQYVVLRDLPIVTDLFVVPRENDSPPHYQKLARKQSSLHNWYGLDNTLLIEYLADFRKQNCPFTIPSYLLQHLMRSWGNFPTRAFPRTQSHDSIDAVIGLAGTNYFINGKQAVMPDLVQSDHTEDDTTKKTKPEHYQKHHWQLMNTSATGYCICAPLAGERSVKIGEIIGLQEKEDGHSPYWHIGVTRWSKHTNENTLQVGVELLSSSGIPVGLQSLHQAPVSNKFFRALLLGKEKGTRENASILAPSINYFEGDAVRVVNQQLDMDVKLTHIMAESASFKQFGFEQLKHFADGMNTLKGLDL